MSSLFEPSPGDSENYVEGDSYNNSSGFDSFDSSSGFGGFGGGGGCGGGGEVEMKSDTGFSVLGTGRFSRVVWARRRQPWARMGTNVCAIKVQPRKALGWLVARLLCYAVGAGGWVCCLKQAFY